MQRDRRQLREDALAIWRAGVAAVDSRRLVHQHLQVRGGTLCVGPEEIELSTIGRIVVVGAGKAGAGMAQGVEEALGPSLLREKAVAGWINVPADCARSLQCITLHPARPAGLNQPTQAGVAGTEQILQLVACLQPDDLCLCLLSGGGSALLPAPVEAISLADKQAVTKQLSDAGADIQQLNTVRKQLSRIKGGGLARACRARKLISLIISDVLGDPLDIIASGPTVPDPTTAADALQVLDRFAARQAGISPAVFHYLEQKAEVKVKHDEEISCQVTNLVIGNNAVAVDAAGQEAERRGYSHAMISAARPEGKAEDVGRHLAQMALGMRGEPGPDCLISGGEPVVELVPDERRGLGGRNQQLALAALQFLLQQSSAASPDNPLEGIVLLSGGTDGEDGPTDAAGALIDPPLVELLRTLGLSPSDYLDRNDAYHFFQQLNGLIKTGPTHTNVCDLRVVTVQRNSQ